MLALRSDTSFPMPFGGLGLCCVVIFDFQTPNFRSIFSISPFYPPRNIVDALKTSGRIGELLKFKYSERNSPNQQLHPNEENKEKMSMLLPATDMSNIMTPSMSSNMQNGMYCRRCGYGGCDVRVMNCGCSAHAVSLSMRHFAHVFIHAIFWLACLPSFKTSRQYEYRVCHHKFKSR